MKELTMNQLQQAKSAYESVLRQAGVLAVDIQGLIIINDIINNAIEALK